ncbi:MAG: hypothetical protein QXI97_06515 [Nitrososphaerota archaeon]
MKASAGFPSALIGYLIVALVIVAVFGVVLRFSTGLLGLVLGALAAGLAIYWLMEINKSLRRDGWKDFLLEIREEGDLIDLTAQVPGPENKVKVELFGRRLVLKGGMGFQRTVKLPFEAILKELRYVNGILNARLEKKEASPPRAR